MEFKLVKTVWRESILSAASKVLFLVWEMHHTHLLMVVLIFWKSV